MSASTVSATRARSSNATAATQTREATRLEPPSVSGFAATLDRIASDERVVGRGVQHAEWVRSGLSCCAPKMRALRFLVDACADCGRMPRLLDVGAQIGSVAEYAGQIGFDSAAVDLDVYASSYGRIVADRGVDFRACDLAKDALPFEDDSFDAVTYLDTIEHHAFSPKRILSEIHRVLAPGGHLVVSTPNHASIYNRVQLALGRSVNDDFATFYNHDPVPYSGHHREYTASELRAALEGAGFRVTACEVHDEDPAILARSIVRDTREQKKLPHWRHFAHLGAAMAGSVFGALSLRFGRLLFAVGRKESN